MAHSFNDDDFTDEVEYELEDGCVTPVDQPSGGPLQGPPGPGNSCPLYCNTGSPEGVITSVIGGIYEQSDAPFDVHPLWVKRSGTGSTGWHGWAGLNGRAGTDDSIAIGTSATTPGPASVSIGNGSSAEGDHSLALGAETFSTADFATALGNGAVASAVKAIAIGTDPEASAANSIAIGWAAIAAFAQSIAFGAHAVTSAVNTMRIGSLAEPIDTIEVYTSGGLKTVSLI